MLGRITEPGPVRDRLLRMDLGEPFRGRDAVAAGLVTPGMLRGPRFRTLLRGVHVLATAEVDFAMRCRAAAVATGGKGVLMGWAAAEMLDASCGPPDAEVEIAVPGGGKPRAGLAVRRISLPADEIITVDGVVATTAERTVLDLGCRRPILDAIIGVDAVRRVCAPDLALVRTLARRHLGIRGSRRLDEALLRSTPLAGSPMETRVRIALEDGGLPPPVLQFRIGPYELDHAYPEVKVAVEYDGRHHLTPERARRDLARQDFLSANGWLVVRPPAELVLHRPEEVAARVRSALRRRSAPR